jgi:hypothetical protein
MNLQAISQYRQTQYEWMSGVGSDYPNTITPLGFVYHYSPREQEILLADIKDNFGSTFYSEVQKLRLLSSEAIAKKARTEPLWDSYYGEP